MIASAFLKGFIHYVTINKYAYVFLHFLVMRIVETKLDVLFKATRAKHAMCRYSRELDSMVFTLETKPHL